jgi:hypothetical protein
MKPSLIIAFLFFYGCFGEQSVPPAEKVDSAIAQQQLGLPKSKSASVQVEGSKGVLVLREHVPLKLILSEDTLMSHSIEIKNFDDPFFKLNRLFAFHKDYGILVFRSEKLTGNWYMVWTQDEKKFYIHAASSLVFEDWETHLLNSAFVYPLDGNSFKQSPKSVSLPVIVSKDEMFSAKVIEGEWVGVASLDEHRKELLWVKWREKGRLLVEIFYFC